MCTIKMKNGDEENITKYTGHTEENITKHIGYTEENITKYTGYTNHWGYLCGGRGKDE